jgi:hypothetical protein
MNVKNLRPALLVSAVVFAVASPFYPDRHFDTTSAALLSAARMLPEKHDQTADEKKQSE